MKPRTQIVISKVKIKLFDKAIKHEILYEKVSKEISI